MNKSFFISFLTILSLSCFAQNEAATERSGYVVHLLNYLGGDYASAVSDGKIINEMEYTEMQNFSENIAKTIAELPLEKNTKDSLLFYASRLQKLVAQKADEKEVKATCDYTKKFLLKTSGLKTAPSAYPLLSKGKTLYVAHCASCHGDTGFGDGLEGKSLDPAPRNFHEEPRMSALSAFGIFNTVRYGIEGTGMTALPQLTDEEVWNVSFYVLSLRYASKGSAEPKISLAQIATLSDEELLQITDSTHLSALRTYEPLQNANPIHKAKDYITQAQAACLNSDWTLVERLVTMAYLEGIEPNEFELKKNHSNLVLELEKNVAAIHASTAKKQGAETMAHLKNLAKLLESTEEKLNAQEYSAWLSAFMTASILLREGLEALIVIIIFMNVLNAANLIDLKKVVHAGWVLSLVAGVLIWLLIGELLSKSRVNIELMEGVLTLSAVAMLLFVGFWMHKRSSMEQWVDYIKKQINSRSGKASVWGIFTLSFIVVFREIFESILFISTIDLQSRGAHRAYILAGGIVAFIIIIVLYQIITRLSARIPFNKIISFSVLILSILAIMLTGKAIHSFQESALIKQNFIGNLPMIDVIGFYPTWETVLAQIAVVIILYFLYRKTKS